MTGPRTTYPREEMLTVMIGSGIAIAFLSLAVLLPPSNTRFEIAFECGRAFEILRGDPNTKSAAVCEKYGWKK